MMPSEMTADERRIEDYKTMWKASQARLAEAERLLDFCVQSLECGMVHHDKHEYHRAVDPCPVMDRLRAFTRPTDSAEPAPDLFASMGLPAVEVPAWERPMRQCHHGHYGDCPRCTAETVSEGQK